ncbi:MAG: DUF2493 domain-containing protein [Candidatus Rokubacteria bacterium]|nr:DUF2493 domain-containing protein [Candidatus Rokubacteria bacterium]
MRVLVCGSRGWTDYDAILRRLAQIEEGRPTIVHGAAGGADTMADRAAKTLKLTVERYPADWAAYGKRAGFIRNDRCSIPVWVSSSRSGTGSRVGRSTRSRARSGAAFRSR